MAKLSDRLRKDAAEIVNSGRNVGLDWRIIETHQWQAADLLDKAEAALADTIKLAIQLGALEMEIDKPREVLAAIRSEGQ